ncbi:FecR domain-containing protein [Aestuariibaculum sp. M13]|uniref:FecR family protein n=1 Tax=Aestuariibaculum sp. M13 TaxID=2967132 RepID=UPI002159E2EC|nr:FecR family protein [Aestuariibaculum sp. M13]MCR8668951.1 FecR domain-containing protein [Aestuariibaculum sp. M13]
MDRIEADRLILRLINNTISEEESEKLAKWVEDSGNLNYFNEFVEVNQLISSKKKFDHRYSLEKFVEKSQAENRFRKRTLYIAASIVIFISLGLFFTKNENSKSEFVTPVIVNNNIEVGSDKATLTLEDGSEVVLEKGTLYENEKVTSNGEELVYNIKDSSSKELAYNTLTIPRGGQFFIKLSDGSKVWLNSESQLKYPISFEEGETREVELVYGEAYFEVTHSTEHQGSHFKVLNRSQEVEVLGTEFNVKAYMDELKIYTTLVTGKVEVSTSNGKKVLTPSQQSIVDVSKNNISISEANVYNEVSWKKGIFSFNDKSLKEIMIVLSRWYDMDVEFANKDIEDKEFIGVLGKDQAIESILSKIKSFGVINNYEINNKKVIIR